MPAALLALLTALAALGVGLDARVNAQEALSTKCPIGEFQAGKTGLWVAYPAPEFSVGPAEVKTHAVDSATGIWYVTNGTVIAVSPDQGCSWKESYVLPENPDAIVPFPRGAAKIVHLEAAAGVAVATIVAPRAEGQANPVDPKLSDGFVNMFIASTDSGMGWARMGDTVPNIGAPGPFVISPRNPSRMYTAVGGIVHISEDGGVNWGARPMTDGGPLPQLEKTSFDSMNVDPDKQDVLWVNDGDSFWHTKDAGTTWRRIDMVEAPNKLVGVAVNKPVGSAHSQVVMVVVGEDGEAKSAIVSDDGGENYRNEPIEGVAGKVIGVGGKLSRTDVVITTEDPLKGSRHGVYRGFPGKTKIDDFDEFDNSPMFEPELVERGKATFFHSFSTMYVHGEPPPADVLPPSGDPPPIPPARPAQLEPAGGDVRVEPGGSVEIDYKLNLPEQPTPIDVFFLLDTSGSTDPYIKGLREGLGEIADKLDQADIAAGYGLGEYQDWTAMRYRRRVDIGPADALKRSLAAIRTAGGEEPGYTAAHQVATGSGIEKVDKGKPIAKGEAPRWRQGTVRTTIMVADEPFSDDPSGPNRDQTVAALKDQRIQLIGVQVTDNPPPPGATASCPAVMRAPDPGPLTLSNTSDSPVRALKLRCQMEDLARETGALAPEGGVDCDGDGTIEVQAGAPLVCTLRREGTTGNKVVAMAKPLVNLLKALKDEQEVRLVPDDTEIKVEVTPGGNYTKLNLKQKHLANFKTVISCTLEQGGKAFPLTLNAKAGPRVVGTARPRVLCGDPPVVPAVVPPVVRKKPAKQPPPEARPVPAPVVPAPPPPIAPQPVPVPAVAPVQAAVVATSPPPPPAQVPAQAPQAVQQTVQSPVGAAAQQKQTQVTPAYVNLDDGDSPEAEGAAELHSGDLYFSKGTDPSRPGGPEWIIRMLGVTAVLTAAFVLAPGNQRRRRSRHRKVRA